MSFPSYSRPPEHPLPVDAPILSYPLGEIVLETQSGAYTEQSAEPIVFGDTVAVDEDRIREFKAVNQSRHPVDTITRLAKEYVCAFLNSNGGTIYFGIHDSGVVLGIPLTATQCVRTQDNIALAVANFSPAVEDGLVRYAFLPVVLPEDLAQSVDGLAAARWPGGLPYKPAPPMGVKRAADFGFRRTHDGTLTGIPHGAYNFQKSSAARLPPPAPLPSANHGRFIVAVQVLRQGSAPAYFTGPDRRHAYIRREGGNSLLSRDAILRRLALVSVKRSLDGFGDGDGAGADLPELIGLAPIEREVDQFLTAEEPLDEEVRGSPPPSPAAAESPAESLPSTPSPIQFSDRPANTPMDLDGKPGVGALPQPAALSAQLQAALPAPAETGPVRLVAISGLPGTGKTRLATTIAARWRRLFPDYLFRISLDSAEPGISLGAEQVGHIPAARPSVPSLDASRMALVRLAAAADAPWRFAGNKPVTDAQAVDIVRFGESSSSTHAAPPRADGPLEPAGSATQVSPAAATLSPTTASRALQRLHVAHSPHGLAATATEPSLTNPSPPGASPSNRGQTPTPIPSPHSATEQVQPAQTASGTITPTHLSGLPTAAPPRFGAVNPFHTLISGSMSSPPVRQLTSPSPTPDSLASNAGPNISLTENVSVPPTVSPHVFGPGEARGATRWTTEETPPGGSTSAIGKGIVWRTGDGRSVLGALSLLGVGSVPVPLGNGSRSLSGARDMSADLSPSLGAAAAVHASTTSSEGLVPDEASPQSAAPPVDSEAIERAYHDVFAHRSGILIIESVGERMRDLLPHLMPPGDALVIVTGRRSLDITAEQLGLPNAYVCCVRCPPLKQRQASALVQRVAPRLLHDDANELARLCGYSSAAIQYAGAAFQVCDSMPAEHLMAELSHMSYSARMSVLDSPMALIFQSLSLRTQRVLLSLSVFDESFTVAQASIVTGLEPRTVRDELASLLLQCLIERCRTAPIGPRAAHLALEAERYEVPQCVSLAALSLGFERHRECPFTADEFLRAPEAAGQDTLSPCEVQPDDDGADADDEDVYAVTGGFTSDESHLGSLPLSPVLAARSPNGAAYPGGATGFSTHGHGLILPSTWADLTWAVRRALIVYFAALTDFLAAAATALTALVIDGDPLPPSEHRETALLLGSYLLGVPAAGARISMRREEFLEAAAAEASTWHKENGSRRRFVVRDGTVHGVDRGSGENRCFVLLDPADQVLGEGNAAASLLVTVFQRWEIEKSNTESAVRGAVKAKNMESEVEFIAQRIGKSILLEHVPRTTAKFLRQFY